MKKGILFVAVAFLFACQSPKGVSGKRTSLVTIKKAVTASLPLGLKRRSSNDREFFSNYFRRPGSRGDRAYVLVKILGERRPYNITVEVYIERKEGGQWIFVEKDQDLSKGIAKKIQKRLSTSRNERNVIDDFRAF